MKTVRALSNLRLFYLRSEPKSNFTLDELNCNLGQPKWVKLDRCQTLNIIRRTKFRQKCVDIEDKIYIIKCLTYSLSSIYEKIDLCRTVELHADVNSFISFNFSRAFVDRIRKVPAVSQHASRVCTAGMPGLVLIGPLLLFPVSFFLLFPT